MVFPGTRRSYDTALAPSTPDASRKLSIANESNDNENGQSSRSHTTAETLNGGSQNSTPLSSPLASPSPPQQKPSIPPSISVASDMAPKKPKLTAAEKEAEKAAKQLKEQQKAEEKARKEEEKRAKDEEREKARQQKEAEKEEKQRAKDEEKQKKEDEKQKKDAAKTAEREAKEAEKRAKDEEKAKKERSQLRLNSFFVKKPQVTESPGLASRRSSISSIGELKAGDDSRAVSEAPAENQSDFEKHFPPFFLHPHTSMAPSTWFPWDDARLEKARRELDEVIEKTKFGNTSIGASTQSRKRRLDDALDLPSRKRRAVKMTPVKDLIARINGTATEPIDVESNLAESREALEALKKVTVKFLRYAEDVRPPYVGTFTPQLKQESITKLCRNPTHRGLPMINYDYDSEAEWDEPEEGEELGSDDEDDEDDDGPNDMDGFLDDEEDAAGPRRRNVMGEMEPVTTGLVWHDRSSKGLADIPFGTATIDLEQYRIAPLLTTATGSIDPYSHIYWGSAPDPDIEMKPAAMAPPPRMPLHSISGGSITNFLSGNNKAAEAPVATVPCSSIKKSKSQAKPLPLELLGDFKQVVDGNDLSKTGLVEVLKKKFPQVTQKTIQSTLDLVAKREGKKEADKRWVLI